VADPELGEGLMHLYPPPYLKDQYTLMQLLKYSDRIVAICDLLSKNLPLALLHHYLHCPRNGILKL